MVELWFHLDFGDRWLFHTPGILSSRHSPSLPLPERCPRGSWCSTCCSSENSKGQSKECNSQAPWLLTFPASRESAPGTGAFQQLCAVLAGSRHKQAQTLLLDPGNCCLRDRFAYKCPSFSRWLFKAGKEKGSLLAQNLPAPALGASPHLSSSFQPPQVPAVGMRHPPQVSAGWRIPAVCVTLQLSLLPAQPPLQPAGR